jgi:hypothetical protein
MSDILEADDLYLLYFNLVLNSNFVSFHGKAENGLSKRGECRRARLIEVLVWREESL